MTTFTSTGGADADLFQVDSSSALSFDPPAARDGDGRYDGWDVGDFDRRGLDDLPWWRPATGDDGSSSKPMPWADRGSLGAPGATAPDVTYVDIDPMWSHGERGLWLSWP